jgi:hypothetical protein
MDLFDKLCTIYPPLLEPKKNAGTLSLTYDEAELIYNFRKQAYERVPQGPPKDGGGQKVARDQRPSKLIDDQRSSIVMDDQTPSKLIDDQRSSIIII